MKTILIVNSQVEILVLMNGILQNDYRVLVAADAESALRLLTIGEPAIELVVLDSNVSSSPPGELRLQMTEVLPRLRILSMAGWVDNGVIRLQALDKSGERLSESLIQKIHTAVTSPKVMVAGRA
jgi:DNA-binding NtrC family response regulator